MAVKHRWLDADGDMANTASWSDGVVPATKATGVLTLTGPPADNDTVLIDTKTYTFKPAVNDANDGEVTIGGTESETLDNLIAAIVLDTPVAGRYATATTLHPSVTAAAGAGDTMDATAKLKGTDGNALSTTVPIGAYGTWGAVTLSGATQWATDDEIAVGMEATQDFLTNLDWSTTTTSPELVLRRFNVDRTNIKFGGPGNPIKLSLVGGALNYLGTGMMYADFKGTLNIYVNSLTRQPVLNLNVRTAALKFCIVHSGEVTIIAGALIDNVDFQSQIYTTGPQAKLIIEGADEDGPGIVIAYSGVIDNARKVVDEWVIIASDGMVIQRGYVRDVVSAPGGVLNLGGTFSYEPINDPVAHPLEARHIAGISRLDLSNYTLTIGDVITGADAILKRGPMRVLGAVDIDLIEDFPF